MVVDNTNLRVLNIGNGDLYIPGAVNIDIDIESLPDVCASGVLLPFQDGIFDRVCSFHVVEHIPYRKIPLFLSEINRVLKPDGQIVLESPDIMDSFERFLLGEEVEKRVMLSFIFGLDIKGMKHELLYPKELIYAELKEAGFGRIRIEEPKTQKGYPGMRVVATKTGVALNGQVWRQLFIDGILQRINQLEVLEVRDVVDKDEITEHDLAILLAMNPHIFRAVVMGRGLNDFMELARSVVEYRITDYEKALFIEGLKGEGLDFDRVLRLVSLKIIRKNKVLEGIEKGRDAGIFSNWWVQKYLRKMLIKGIRSFHRGQLDEAKECFEAVTKVGLGGYGRINLASVLWALGNIRTAAKLLEGIALSEGLYDPLKKEAEKRLNALKNGEEAWPPLRYGDVVYTGGEDCDS